MGRGIRLPSGWRMASTARARVAPPGRPAGRKSSSGSTTTTTAAGETPAATAGGGGGGVGSPQQGKGRGGAYKVFEPRRGRWISQCSRGVLAGSWLCLACVFIFTTAALRVF